MSNLNTQESIISPENLTYILFKTKGRLPRFLYVMTIASQITFVVAVVMTMRYLFLHGSEDDAFLLIVTPLAAMLLVWSLFSSVIKRLHDLGKSGVLSLLVLIPGVNVAFLTWLAMRKGTDGPNKYGYANHPQNSYQS